MGHGGLRHQPLQGADGLAGGRDLAVDLQRLAAPLGVEEELDELAHHQGVAIPQLDGAAIPGDGRLDELVALLRLGAPRLGGLRLGELLAIQPGQDERDLGPVGPD